MKLLLPQPKSAWRQPSQRESHNCKRDQTRFRLTARYNDGAIFWRGWFDDREDADEFLWALARGQLIYERELWRLPNPAWHSDFDPGLVYDFATVTFLTVYGSNRTYTKPSDWNNANNIVEAVGGGGNGYSGQGVALGGGGGGGGAYSATPNLTISGANTNYWVGNTQEGSYFGYSGTNYNSSQVYADYGRNSVQVYYGGAGGLASSGRGITRYNGGASQNCYYGASAGGGAGGPNGPGAPGGGSVGDYASSGGGGGGANGGATGANGAQGAVGGNGGNNRLGTGGGIGGTGIAPSGVNGGGGAGGCGYGYGQAAVHAGNGGSNDQCWDATHGCGGGSGGGGDGGDNTGIVGGYGYPGGDYGGGGGGGGAGTYSGSSGGGAQGIVVVTYTPQALTTGFNMPMMGM